MSRLERLESLFKETLELQQRKSYIDGCCGLGEVSKFALTETELRLDELYQIGNREI